MVFLRPNNIWSFFEFLIENNFLRFTMQRFLLRQFTCKKMTFGCSNCPMIEASVRKSVLALSLDPGLRVLMATSMSCKNIWHYYTKIFGIIYTKIFGMTPHLSTVLVQSTSTHVSKLSSANYGLNCNVAGILGKWGYYQTLTS